MKAIIMAGGKGERLQPVTHGCPKPMVRLLGRPILEHTIILLRDHGFNDICITLCARPESIRTYFGDGRAFGVSLSYREERAPLGTAGSVKNCADFIGNDDVLVLSGDAVCDFDLSALMDVHSASRAAATLALTSCADPLRYGLVLTDSGGEIVSFIEKPAWERVVTDLVNTGIYVLSPLAVELIPQETYCDFAQDLFPKMLDMVIPLRAAVMDGYWCDVGSPATYLQCSMDALYGRVRLQTTGRCLAPGIHCASRLPENVRLHPPCFIGPGAVIGAGCILGPEAVINPGSILGSGVQIRTSVVDGGEIGAHSTLTGTILCRDAKLAPGAKTQSGTVIAAPGGRSAPIRPPLNTRQQSAGHTVGEIPCADRAHLMRLFSEALMEAGADFTDGLVFGRAGGLIRLAPSSEKSAVVIEALSGSDEDLKLAEQCRKLAAEWTSREL